MREGQFLSFDHIIARNPFDMAEGGDVRDVSTRMKYLMTARRMIQPIEPNPFNKMAVTSKLGILFGGIPFRKPGAMDIYDNNFYSGLLVIDDQPLAKQARPFTVSGSPKQETNI